MIFCEDHFSEDQFMCPADKGSGKSRIRLRKDAVPTLFNIPNASKVAPRRCKLVSTPTSVAKERGLNHSEAKGANSTGLKQCLYCLKVFESVASMAEHKKQMHEWLEEETGADKDEVKIIDIKTEIEDDPSPAFNYSASVIEGSVRHNEILKSEFEANSKTEVMFCCCELGEGEMAVIPSSWLFRQSDESLWCRLSSSQDNVKRIIAPDASWPIYEVQRVLHKTFTYEEAHHLLDSLITEAETSSFEVEINDPSEPPRKIRRKTVEQFPVAEEVVVSSALDLQPTPAFSLSNPSTIPASTDTPAVDPAVFPTSSPLVNISSSFREPTAENSLSTGSSLSEVVDMLANTAAPEVVQSPQFQLLLGLCRETLSVCHQTRKLVLNLQRDMDRVKVHIKSENTDPQECNIVLFNDMGPFLEFCDKLSDPETRKEMANGYASRFGRCDVGETLRSCLSATMSNELMTQFSRTGRENKRERKRKFPSSLEDLIYMVCRKYNPQDPLRLLRNRQEITTSLRLEVQHQLEVYLANSKARMMYQLKKNNDLQ
ncbi:hypothetical protein CAPTEDRAFT_226042 [Capitella teleta]|uniref:THAP-type domain-containing protein n=1 Tax=Capitella teleta TaxID=283909 RepID=R7TUP7_CAPTE|nr:hypothetical protein CAPTEDRAFT_226042 [Capitella teleta]|eukprot:ELT94740.1 hypothetical protein CAPTEDRAFT_226042 [Capitella teleta]